MTDKLQLHRITNTNSIIPDPFYRFWRQVPRDAARSGSSKASANSMGVVTRLIKKEGRSIEP